MPFFPGRQEPHFSLRKWCGGTSNLLSVCIHAQKKEKEKERGKTPGDENLWSHSVKAAGPHMNIAAPLQLW